MMGEQPEMIGIQNQAVVAHWRGRAEAAEAALGEAHALLTRMALRLDELEPGAPERAEFLGSVEWRGSSADYFANSAAINHTLAHELARTLESAQTRSNKPDISRLNPGALHAQAIEASTQEPEAEGGQSSQVPSDDHRRPEVHGRDESAGHPSG